MASMNNREEIGCSAKDVSKTVDISFQTSGFVFYAHIFLRIQKML